MASTITVISVVDWARTYPGLTKVLGAPVAGYTQEPALTLANNVMQEMLSEPYNFKWNSVLIPAFLTNGLQQDYATSITNLSWLESAIRTDINSTTSPKPIRGVEVKRELLPTSQQFIPSQMCWIPNSECQTGTWQASTTFVSQLGKTGMPIQPYTQITDSNGNLQLLTTFGTTGSVQPAWNTNVGGTTNDGTAVWTMQDPNGVSLRLSPLPPQSGTVWQITGRYQKKPPVITALSQTWAPIPDELSYVYKQGFLAHAFKAADDSRYLREYQTFEGMIQKALGSADREQDEYGMYPTSGLMGGGGSSTDVGGDVPWGYYYPNGNW